MNGLLLRKREQTFRTFLMYHQKQDMKLKASQTACRHLQFTSKKEENTIKICEANFSLIKIN